MRYRESLIIVLVLGCLPMCGCGGDSHAPERKSAEESFARGKAAVEARNWAEAKLALGDAMAGVLSPDLYCEAGVQLAISLAHLDESDAALEIVAKLETGAPNMAEVLSAKAFALQKKGDSAGAQQAFAEARKYNRTVKMPN